jgi:hypothetical protein
MAQTPFVIDFAGMPMNMKRDEAVLSFVSDSYFPAPIPFLVLIGQTIFEKNLMDDIVKVYAIDTTKCLYPNGIDLNRLGRDIIEERNKY